MTYSKRTWIVISGITWFAIGVMLLFKGLRFIVGTIEAEGQHAPLLNMLAGWAGSRHHGALLLVGKGLLLGFIKGRTILAKTVKRISERIFSAPENTLTWKEAYDRKYFIILGAMVGIGLAFRVLPIPLDIRGLIDVAIGSALINGAMLYFRQLVVPQKA